jgi:hypothetical protein
MFLIAMDSMLIETGVEVLGSDLCSETGYPD